MPGPLLIVSSHGELSLTEPTPPGRPAAARRLAERAAWPSWRPGTRQFAVSELFPGGESRLIILDADGQQPAQAVHKSPAGEAIAPRVHHYALWSPDGSRLAYVTKAGDSLGLSVFHPASGSNTAAIVEGAPVFSAWSADSRYLLCHAGLSLQVVDAWRGEVLRVISEEAAGFRVAAIAPDGTVVYGVAETGALRLLETRIEAGPTADVGRFGGGVAMAFRPGGQELAVGVTRSPETGTFEELWLVRLTTGEKTLISRGPYVAYWWSPDGGRIALAVPAQTGDGRHYVRVINTAGEQLAATESIVPSADFRIAAGFFDQYGLSHPVWSADGEDLLLAGRRLEDSVHSTLGDPAGDMVYAWKALRGEPLKPVLPGQCGFPVPGRVPQ